MRHAIIVKSSLLLHRRFSADALKQIVFTHKKYFTLKVEVSTKRQNDRVYSNGKESDILPQRLYHSRPRLSIKTGGKHRSFLEWKN